MSGRLPRLRQGPRTRRSVLATLSASGSTALLACSTPGRPPDGGAGPGTLKTGVTLTMMQYGTVPEGESKLQVLKLFEERYPGLKANLDNAPLGYNDKVLTMMAAGTAPDVFWFNPALFLEYTRRGFLLDLTPLLRRDRYDTADFPDKALAQYHWQSKQWGMPKDFPARGMFFNVAAFDQAGVGHPPATFADPGWTWDRFLDAAQRLTRDRGGVSQFGWTMGTGFREWMVWVYGNGGEFVRQDAAECALHEAPAVDALQFLQDLRTKHRVVPAPADAQQGATFPLGRVAMIESGPFQVGNFRRQIEGFVWDGSPMPRGRAGRYATTGGGAGQGIGATTKTPDEAWALLKHVMSPEALMIEIVKDHLNMPGRKSLANSKEYLQSGLLPKNLKVFVEGLNHLRLDPQTTNWGEIEAATATEMAPLWTGEKSARDVAQGVKRAVDPLLKAAEAKRRL